MTCDDEEEVRMQRSKQDDEWFKRGRRDGKRGSMRGG